MTFAVMVETHEGKVMALRRKMISREIAEDHPVVASLWKRVWVEEEEIKPVVIPTLPPRPWSIVPSYNHAGHIWICDATGKKIATIWGSIGERKLTSEHIIDLVNRVAS
jgi:hypothetical protein